MLVKIGVGSDNLILTPAVFKLLERVGERILNQEGASDAELSVLLVNNAEIRRLNKRWRGIDAPTDVLAFSQREGDTPLCLPAEIDLLGDVVISVEQATQQAKERGKCVNEELAWLLIHGTLHLLGYDHLTESQKKRMQTRQREILAELGLGWQSRGGSSA